MGSISKRNRYEERWIDTYNGCFRRNMSEHGHCRKAFKTLKTMGVDHAMDQLRKSVVTSFHVGKNASVGWLHTHCRVSALDTVALDAMETKSIQDGLGSKLSHS